MTSIRRLWIKIFLAFIVLAYGAPCFAVYTGFSGLDSTVSVDLPEGFTLLEKSQDDRSFMLGCDVAPVTAVIRIYDTKRYSTAKKALEGTLKALGAHGDLDELKWRNQSAAVATFDAVISGVSSSGLGAASLLPEDDAVIVMLIWSQEESYSFSGPLMASFLDSLCIDKGSYFESGIITSYAYPKSEVKIPLELVIDGITVKTELCDNDKEASEYLIEREYQVLCMYRTSPLWREAWQRYYRMIYRDSSHRLMKCSFDVYNALAPSSSDDTALAQKLLNWTQTFRYERDPSASDFASLPSVLLGGGSDCDSRSLLLCVLLRAMNMDAVMFVSNVHSHAVAGLVSDHPGFGFSVNEKTYLVGETTVTGLTWGKIDKNQADQADWITVELP